MEYRGGKWSAAARRAMIKRHARGKRDEGCPEIRILFLKDPYYLEKHPPSEVYRFGR